MKKLLGGLQNICKSLKASSSQSEKKEVIIKKTDKHIISGIHTILNPIEGEVVDLTNVPEGAFAGRCLGDGFAIVPSDNKVYSPVNGEVVLIFPTKHAILILTEEGLEMLIHIGIGTVNLKGEVFNVHVDKGSKVKKGDLLMTFDFAAIKENGKSLISPIIITNMDIVKKLIVDFGNKKSLEKVAEVTVSGD